MLDIKNNYPYSFVRIILFILGINALFYIASFYVFLNRPLINFDYFFIVIFCILYRKYSFYIFLFLICVDVFYSFSLTFHFVDFKSALQQIQFINLLSLDIYLFKYFIIFFVFLIVSYFYFKKLTNGLIINTSLLKFISCFFFVIISIDFLNGSMFFLQRDQVKFQGNISGSALIASVDNLLSRTEKDNIRPLSSQEIIYTDDSFTEVIENSKLPVVFVIVESLGLSKSTKINELVKINLSIDGYKILSRARTFKGSTTNAELRNLCGFQGSYSNLTYNNALSCLPHKMKKIGYTTYGIHGFSGRMFNRNKWWPMIGIDHSYFAESPELDKLQKCGSAFRGICDDDIFNFAFDKLNSIGKTPNDIGFYYILTLDSHLPVIIDSVSLDFERLCRVDNLTDAACKHTFLLNKTLGSLAEKIKLSKIKPLVVVVGDHSPPFSNLDARNDFSNNLVPSFILIPN